MLMKTRLSNEQMRCSIAGGGQSFVNFLFIFNKTKEKHTVFELFNLRIHFENFTNAFYIIFFIIIFIPDYLAGIKYKKRQGGFWGAETHRNVESSQYSLQVHKSGLKHHNFSWHERN